MIQKKKTLFHFYLIKFILLSLLSIEKADIFHLTFNIVILPLFVLQNKNNQLVSHNVE